MKSYKIIENTDSYYSRLVGRVVIQFEDQAMNMKRTILSATPTLPHTFWGNETPGRLVEKGLAKEIDLLQEKWLHYHLYKPLKKVVSQMIGVEIP